MSLFWGNSRNHGAGTSPPAKRSSNRPAIRYNLILLDKVVGAQRKVRPLGRCSYPLEGGFAVIVMRLISGL